MRAPDRFGILSALVYLTAAADWHSTTLALRAGQKESNPILSSVADDPAALGIIKLGAACGVNRYSHHLRVYRKRFWWAPQVAWIVINGAVARHNYMLEKE